MLAEGGGSNLDAKRALVADLGLGGHDGRGRGAWPGPARWSGSLVAVVAALVVDRLLRQRGR